ncbi:MAG: metallophosphoesterase family protein, partial [Spirochaetota bacterium]
TMHSPCIFRIIRCRALPLFICAAALCMTQCAHNEPFIRSKKDHSFAIWALSDIQPMRDAHKKSFERAVEDAAENFPQIDMAIVAGDIVQASKKKDPAPDWRWYLDTRGKAGIRNWYEIAGNHDARHMDSYLAYTRKPLHYAVLSGNILCIFMSDTEDSSGTDIPDPVFLWWKKLVESHRDKIIITVTHSNPEHVGFIYALIDYRNLQGSERFEKVLKNEPTDLWLFGHTHNSPFTLKMENDSWRYNVLFINVSAIREEYFYSRAMSRLILFEDGSDTVTIKLRDHKNKLFLGSGEITRKLKAPYRWSPEEPVMIPYTKTQ